MCMCVCVCEVAICCVALRMRAPEACEPGHSADVVELPTDSPPPPQQQMPALRLYVICTAATDWLKLEGRRSCGKSPDVKRFSSRFNGLEGTPGLGGRSGCRQIAQPRVLIQHDHGHSGCGFVSHWFPPLVVGVAGADVHIWQQIQKQTATQRYVLLSYVIASVTLPCSCLSVTVCVILHF